MSYGDTNFIPDLITMKCFDPHPAVGDAVCLNRENWQVTKINGPQERLFGLVHSVEPEANRCLIAYNGCLKFKCLDTIRLPRVGEQVSCSLGAVRPSTDPNLRRGEVCAVFPEEKTCYVLL